MSKYKGLSLEDEKYLNMVNKLSALDLIELEKKKEEEIGLADSNFDYKLLNICERNFTM